MTIFFRAFGVLGFLTVVCPFNGQAQAQSYLSPGYLFGEVRDALGIVPMPTPPDFVVRGRPDPSTLDYIPLKAPPKGFHSEANTPGRRLEAEAPTIMELEAARADTQARAAAAAPPPASQPAKKSVTASPVEQDPPPMKWNPWDTE